MGISTGSVPFVLRSRLQLAELHNTQFVFGIALGNLQLGGIGTWKFIHGVGEDGLTQGT